MTEIDDKLDQILEGIRDIKALLNRDSDDDLDIATTILEDKGYLSTKDIKRHPALKHKYAGKRWKMSALLDKVGARCNCQEIKMGVGGRRYLYTEKGEETVMEIAQESAGRCDSRYIKDRLRKLEETLDSITWEQPLPLQDIILNELKLSLQQYDNVLREMKRVPAFKGYRIYTFDGAEYVYQKKSDAENKIKEEANRVLERAKEEIQEGHLRPTWREWVKIALPPEVEKQLEDNVSDISREYERKMAEQRKQILEKLLVEFIKMKEEGHEPSKGWMEEKAAKVEWHPEKLSMWLQRQWERHIREEEEGQ